MKNAFTLLLLCAALASGPAAAQYPGKPVRLIVPFPAGGPTDTVARIVSQAVATSIGQPIVVESKPGASGAIAAQAAAAAPADGYTLFFATSSVLALPLVTRPAPFDTLADFAPVSTVGRFAFCLYVHPGVPSQSVRDFVAHARTSPSKLSYASNNVAEDLAASQFMKVAGVEFLKVPYKGVAQAIPDLIAGRVQVFFGPIAAGLLQHAADGRIRVLATVTSERTPLTPSVPTMAEAGFPGFSVQSYQMVLAPAKTPREIIDRLSHEINLAVRSAEVRAQLEKHGLVVGGSTPEWLAATLQEDNRTWAQFARESKLVPQ